MQTGKLRTPITLQTKTTTVDPTGAPLETWTDVATLRGRINERTTATYEKFLLAADQEQARVSTLVTIRHRPDLSPATHRLLINGVIHDILAVLHPVGQHGPARYITLLCERIAR